MRFSANGEWPLQDLGRFRLSVSADPAAFNRERMRSSAMKLTRSVGEARSGISHPRRPTGRLRLSDNIQKSPSVWLICMLTRKTGTQAIAAYSRLIIDETTDASLFYPNAARLTFATEQWDLAKADWRRAVELQPELARQRSTTSRWPSAGTKPPSLAADADRTKPERHDAVGPGLPAARSGTMTTQSMHDFCRRSRGRLTAQAPPAKPPNGVAKPCLLRAEVQSTSLNFPAICLPSRWTTEQYRTGYVLGLVYPRSAGLPQRRRRIGREVRELNPNSSQAQRCCPRYEPGHPRNGSASTEASRRSPSCTRRSRAAHRTPARPIDRNHHDLLIAEILFHEAEALMKEKEQPKESDSEEK